MISAEWVPRNCKLFVIFDPSSGKWTAAVRLADDYLGFLVNNQQDNSAELAVLQARHAYETAAAHPESLDTARASYFRRAMKSEAKL